MAGRRVIAREIQSMLGLRFKVAESIVRLAEAPDGTVKQIGSRFTKRPMFAQEAKRIRAAAEERIRLVDEDEPERCPRLVDEATIAPFADCGVCKGSGKFDGDTCASCVWRRWYEREAKNGNVRSPEEVDALRSAAATPVDGTRCEGCRCLIPTPKLCHDCEGGT